MASASSGIKDDFEGSHTYTFIWTITDMLEKLNRFHQNRTHLDSRIFHVTHEESGADLALRLRLRAKTYDYSRFNNDNMIVSANLIKEATFGCDKGVSVWWKLAACERNPTGQSEPVFGKSFYLAKSIVWPESDEEVQGICEIRLEGKGDRPEAHLLKLHIEVLWPRDIDWFKISKIQPKEEDISKMEKYSDVKLLCQGKEFRCHKVILARKSPVFDSMFSQENFQEMQRGEVGIEDMTPEELDALLKFIYTGECDDCVAVHARALLVAADKYDVKDLMVIIQKVLAKILSHENAVEIMLLANLHNAHDLKKKAIQTIARNLDKISNQDTWLEMKEENYDIVSLIEIFADSLKM